MNALDLDLSPLAQAIKATLPTGRTFVLIVIEERTQAEVDAGKSAHTQIVSPLNPPATFKAMQAFIAAAKDNPIFNQKVVSENA